MGDARLNKIIALLIENNQKLDKLICLQSKFDPKKEQELKEIRAAYIKAYDAYYGVTSK